MREAKGSQARDEKGRRTWTDDVQGYRLTDEHRRNTHDDISARSKLGDHARQTAADLVDGVLRGEIRPESLAPLVAVGWKTQVYVAFSNRRLHTVMTWKRPLVIHSLALSSRVQVQRGENMREVWHAGLGLSWRTPAASRSMAQLAMSSGGFEGARVPASVPPRDGSVRAAPSSAAPAGLPGARGISDAAATPGSQAAAAPIPE